MEKVILYWRNRRVTGSVTVKSLHNKAWYEKYSNFWCNGIGCDVTVSEMHARYIKWMDHTGLITANHDYNYGLSTLCHKKKGIDKNTQPPGFDHTSQWKFKDGKWPLFFLTEPHCPPDEEEQARWNFLCEKHGLRYHIHKPSEKSLWVPNSTYMIFWWSPYHFDLDSIPEIMTHDDSDKIRCSLRYHEADLPT